MRKTLAIVLFSLIIAVSAHAQPSPAQLERVKAAWQLLKEVDGKSLEETLEQLKASAHFEGSLAILEAVASTYRDMVAEYAVEGQARKEWLHSMVLLNMAYFQMGGNDEEEGETGLNIIIRRKLKRYLPEGLMADKRLFHSLELNR